MLIGCPVSHREWILPLWRSYVEVSLAKAGIENFSFIFAVSKSDTEMMEMLESWDKTQLVLVGEMPRKDKRLWDEKRIRYMTDLRNTLLEAVRKEAPDYFFSLDSDILLHRDAVESAMSVFEENPDVWAVGLKAYMTPQGQAYPSVANYKDDEHRQKREKGYLRPDVNDVIFPDAIMAAKIMTPDAYHVDYVYKRWGEDGGWSDALIMDRGGVLAFDGRVVNKHVMNPDFLVDMVTYDERAGW